MAAQTMEQNIHPTSGSDQDGPIWGYHFVLNQPAQPISSEAAVEAVQVFRSPIEVLSRLFRDQASVLVDIVRKSTKRVDPMEQRLLAKRISVSRSELGSLRRMLVRLQRLLAPEPAAFFRLLSRPPDWIAEEELQNLQQAAEKFSTAISDTAALVERVQTASGRIGRPCQGTDQSHAI